MRRSCAESDFTSTPAEAYGLTRIRLGLAFRPVEWLRLFAEAEDSRVEFYQVTPPSTLSDPFDLHQTYVEVGAIEGDGVKVRAGRQELFIGSLRLISTGDWSNIAKNFDVARGTITEGGFQLDMIAGSRVLDDPTRLDRNKPGERFYVACSTLKKVLPGASIEPYVMAKTDLNVKGKDGKLGNADTIYGGLCVIGKLKAFDYNAEAVKEGGSYGDDVVQALGYAAGAGWLITDTPARPHGRRRRKRFIGRTDDRAGRGTPGRREDTGNAGGNERVGPSQVDTGEYVAGKLRMTLH